jgi:predicted permease
VSFSYDGVARLAEGATIESSNTELRRATETFPAAFGWDRAEWDRMGIVGFVRDLKAQTVGDVGAILWLFAGAGAFVLLLAWANVANLFLVRSESRATEAHIRKALGASRGQLLRYWVAEGAWVAILSALLGLAIAAAAVGAIVDLAPDLPRIQTVTVSPSAMVFNAALTAIAAMIFGAVPLLAGDEPGNARGATRGLGARRNREVLVGIQMALALTLSIGAALMLQSVSNVMSANPGFDPGGVLTFRLSLPSADYPDREAAARSHQELLDRLAALPGVERAGIARCLPLQGWCGGDPVSSPDSDLPAEAFRKVVSVKPVSSGYFETLRIPLLAGRTFTPSDQTQRSGAAIVSQALAARVFPETPAVEAIGRRIFPQGSGEVPDWYTIVGVAESVQRTLIEEPPAETLYLPLLGIAGNEHLPPIHDVIVAVRVDGPPLAAIDMVHAAVRELDANVPIARIRTLADIHASASASDRLTTLLLTLAAGTGLLLGAIGIYGVVSWATRRRTAEFGVRAALGARGIDLLRMVMVRSLAVIGAGVLVGLVGSLAAGRFLAAMLYQISATDLTTFAGVTALLVAIGTLATWLPARRAARIDPVEALRSR